MLAPAPDLVGTAAMTEPGYTGPRDDAAAVLFDKGVGALAANGVLGDPRGASSDAGQAHVAAFLDAIERQLRDAPEGSAGSAGRRPTTQVFGRCRASP
jgi:creatinine amidohydrolase